MLLPEERDTYYVVQVSAPGEEGWSPCSAKYEGRAEAKRVLKKMSTGIWRNFDLRIVKVVAEQREVERCLKSQRK